MLPLQYFASGSAAGGGLIDVLGIDWMMLSFQIIAFLIIVWLLGKLVYPWLIKSIDERHDQIELSTKAAQHAQKLAEEAEKKVEKLLHEAREEAKHIAASAKAEAAEMVAKAEEKSRQRADKIAADAADQIEKDILAAKKALRGEMIDLVSMATEKILGQAVTSKIDSDLITKAIKEVE